MVRNWTKLIIVQSIPVVLTSVLPERVILCKFKIFFTCSVSSSWTVKTSPLERLYQISHKKKFKKFNLSLAGSFYQCNNHVTIIYYCIFIIFINFHYFEQFRLSFVLGPFEPSRNRCRNKKLNNRNSSFLRFHEPFVMHLVIMGSKNDSLFILICSWTIDSIAYDYS